MIPNLYIENGCLGFQVWFKVGHRPSCWERIRSGQNVWLKVSRWKVSGTQQIHDDLATLMTRWQFVFEHVRCGVHFHPTCGLNLICLQHNFSQKKWASTPGGFVDGSDFRGFWPDSWIAKTRCYSTRFKKKHTVDLIAEIRRSPVEVGSLSHWF